jgi:hypothetical protein
MKKCDSSIIIMFFGFIIAIIAFILAIVMVVSGEIIKSNAVCYDGTMTITSEEQLEDITKMIDENYSGGLFGWFGKPYYIKSQSNGEYILDYQFLSKDSHLPLDKYIK